MINVANTSRAYSEVYEFIKVLGNEYKNKLPSEVYLIIQDYRDKNYNPVYEINQNIDSNIFSKEAISLICALNLQYWCEDEREKERLKNVYIKNQKIEDEKYCYENLMKNNSIQEVKEIEEQKNESMQMIEYKEESILNKIISKFKNILKKMKLYRKGKFN